MEDSLNSSLNENVTLNSSDHERNREILIELNDQMAITLLPAIIFLAIVMIVGFVGNSIVCYVFIFKLKSSTQNLLLIFLAVFDLLSCCIAMPTEIVDMRYYYLFESVAACKLLRFIITFCVLASIMTLLIIALDRYRKICRPLQLQLTKREAKIGVAIGTGVVAVFSIPALIMYGKRTAKTEVAGVEGIDCSTSDKFLGQIYPLIYESVLGVGFLLFSTALGVIYFRIWREIRRHKKYLLENSSLGLSLISSQSDGRGSDPPSSVSTPRLMHERERLRTGERQTPSQDQTIKPVGSVRSKAERTTVIAFLVTFVFVASFLPHLCLILARTIAKGFDHNLKGAALVSFNMFLRSYFVNNAANPIIYGAMNLEFRRECTKLGRSLLCCCSRKRS